MRSHFPVLVDDILVSSEIIEECFACDYSVCKGACCVIGDSGAPLNEDEPAKIKEAYPSFKGLLSAKSVKTIEEKGFGVIDGDGDLVTPLCDGTEECTFCHTDDSGNIFCAMEMTSQGKSFRKPVSCALYPIRVLKMSNGNIALNLHRWEICKCAFEKGRKENIRVYEFLKDIIIRTYGQDFYDALDACRREFDRENKA